MLTAELADLTPQQRRRFIAIAHLLSSSRSVLLLKDYHDLDVDDAVAAVAGRWRRSSPRCATLSRRAGL